MKTPKRLLPLAVILAALFPAASGLAQSGPPMPPIIWLDSYSFLKTNLVSDFNYAPLNFTNALVVQDCWGNALMLDTTNLEPASLNCRIIETNGHLNIDLAGGALFASIVPDWASADTNQNGQGPGEEGFLLAAGDGSPGSPQGLWALYVDAGGTNIYFAGLSNSVATIYVSAPISWCANSYHEVAVTYSTNSTLYLDGQFAASGGPVTIVPATNTWTNGFFIGSDSAGYEQFRGIFLYLEFDTTNAVLCCGTNYFTSGWAWDSNDYDTWAGAQGGFHPDNGSGGFHLPPTPTNAVNTNYAAYTNFWLLITNTGGQAQVNLINPCRGLTYLIMTNAKVEPITSTNWQPWVTLVGSNTVTPAPPLRPASNTLYFCAELVPSTGTNGLPDNWCLEYYNTLNVDPYADPDGDGLCNLTEYLLGSNPTNAHSISAIHTDAQALFLAYTNDSACRYHLSVTNGTDGNTLLATMWPTAVGTNYQIYSQSSSNGAWSVETSFVGADTATTVSISINGRTLSLIGGYGEDSDGDGLPDGYEALATLTDPYLPDTGLTGTPDGYKDPDGDGYVNIVEFDNGTDPHVFNAPPPPTGLTVEENNDGSATINWSASPGNVTGYVIYRDTGSGMTAIATNSQTSYHDTSLSSGQNASYQIQALYSGGLSLLSASLDNLYNPHYSTQVTFANGRSNQLYLVASTIPAGVTKFQVTISAWADSQPFYPQDPWLGQAYGQYNSSMDNTTFEVPVASFTNGLAAITPAQVPWYGGYYFNVQPMDDSGRYGDAVWCGGSYSTEMIPFLDGTEQMKENALFLLRIAVDDPFAPQTHYNGVPYGLTYSTQDVFASYYSFGVARGFYRYRDEFMPFEDNYFYRNYVFNAEDLLPDSGSLATGVTNFTTYDIVNRPGPLEYNFPTFDYVNHSNAAPIAPLLLSNNSQYLWAGDYYLDYDILSISIGELASLGCYPWDMVPLSNFGISADGTSLSMTAGGSNFYGIPYNSFLWPTATSPTTFVPLSIGSGSIVPQQFADYPLYFYQDVRPCLRTVGYYFARFATA